MPRYAKSRVLVLFDIDGTLLSRSGPHHRQVLEEAIWQVAGVRSTTDGIPVQGMLDGDILQCMLRQAGAAEAAPELMLAIMKKAQALYVRRCPDLREKVCPGAPQLLERLAAEGVVVGLVTGNLSRIGWRKMTQAGLRPHIRYGAFAEQGATRAELAGLALAEARRREWLEAPTVATLIGDHPNDILAARANGLRSVAVGTGVVP
ncbi:HAD family hydrolase [Paludibaculum fermentans]|uniref:HAD family hydrolase n=1 Tax=Paludibaculum fermentans TaxID=1473598 RepID=UPI003EC0AB7D